MASPVRHAFRRLRREPWFAITAIATLALGIGACTVMYSIVHAVLLRPIGIDTPSRVVVLRPTIHGVVGEFPFRAAADLSERGRMRSIEEAALVSSVNWSGWLSVGGDRPTVLPMAAVSSAFFDVLGAPPLLGRTFRPADDDRAAPRVLILSHGLWVRAFGARPDVIGTAVRVNEHLFEIVGVMREEFFLPRGAEYWVPAGRVLADNAQAENLSLDDIVEGLGVFHAVGRLSVGATVNTVRAETQPYLTSVAQEQKLDLKSAGISVTSLPDHIFGAARPALLLLMGAVVAVLLIACTNVAGLLVTRDASHTREIAVRAALGAGRGRLVGQLLAESGVLAVSGAVVGVTVAALAVGPIAALSPADIPRLDAATLDLRVVAFAVLVTVVTTLAVGLLPAWRLSAPSLTDALKGVASSASASGRFGIRQTLVAAQVALTLVLLIASALCIRSFARLAQLDLGFDPNNVLTFAVTGPSDAAPTTRAQDDDLLEQILTRIERDPRVVAAGAVLQLPFVNGPVGWDSSFLLEEQIDSPDSWSSNPHLNLEAVTPHYFRSMGIRLIRGRVFTEQDRADSPLVLIVSDAMAARVWPGEDPIGKRLRVGFSIRGDSDPPVWQTVVGVVATARYREIDLPRLDVYAPSRQAEAIVNSFAVRTTVSPALLIPTVTSVLAEVSPGSTVDRVATMDEIVRRTRGPWLFSAMVFSAFGIVALGLCCLGLFGLVGYAVTHRTREIGIRMSLGALPHNVVALIVRQGTGPVVVGLGVGAVGAFVATRLLSGLLFETSPTDLATFASVSAAFAVVSGVAGYLPARRAAAVDPVAALRAE